MEPNALRAQLKVEPTVLPIPLQHKRTFYPPAAPPSTCFYFAYVSVCIGFAHWSSLPPRSVCVPSATVAEPLHFGWIGPWLVIPAWSSFQRNCWCKRWLEQGPAWHCVELGPTKTAGTNAGARHTNAGWSKARARGTRDCHTVACNTISWTELGSSSLCEL